MSTSGNIALTYTRDDIIQEALEQTRAVEIGATPEARLVTSASRTLNMMVKAWQTAGLQLHTVQRSYLFTSPDQRIYRLDSSGTDRWVTAYSETGVKVDAVAGDSTIDVDSTTSIVDGTLIGIYLDDNTMHWDVVDGAPVGDTVTLTTGNIADAASINNKVYFYQSSAVAGRPMEIIEVFERNESGNDRPLDLISRNEYAELTLKTNTGGMVSIFYDPQVKTPNVFIWPIPEDPRTILGTWVKRTIENFDVAADDADFPQEAYLALSFNLAMLLVGKMAVSLQTMQYITTQAGIWYANYQDYAGKPEEDVEFFPFDDVDWDSAGSDQP